MPDRPSPKPSPRPSAKSPGNGGIEPCPVDRFVAEADRILGPVKAGHRAGRWVGFGDGDALPPALRHIPLAPRPIQVPPGGGKIVSGPFLDQDPLGMIVHAQRERLAVPGASAETDDVAGKSSQAGRSLAATTMQAVSGYLLIIELPLLDKKPDPACQRYRDKRHLWIAMIGIHDKPARCSSAAPRSPACDAPGLVVVAKRVVCGEVAVPCAIDVKRARSTSFAGPSTIRLFTWSETEMIPTPLVQGSMPEVG